MIQRVAREELRKAKANGFCGFCFASGDGKTLNHKPGCKGVNDAGLKRRRRR